MYARSSVAAVAAVVLEVRHCCVRPEEPWWEVHHSPMAESWEGEWWIMAS